MKTRAFVFASLLGASFATTWFVACGGSTSDDSDGSQDGSTSDALGGDASGDGGSQRDGGSSSDASLSSACPGSIPAAGTPCTIDGLICEYGSSDLEFCNTVAKCTSGTFDITPPEDACQNELDAGGTCPATLGEIEAGSACPTFGQACTYAEGSCGCGFVNHSADEWVCDTSPGAGCPTPRPKLGSTCSPNGLMCDYGACTILGNPDMACDGGVWFDVTVPCPP
ncbi:MAG: hypothetical protein ACRELY_27215 [Polyangiaceae bacterium]